ncbi:amphi-Trp domain-containing protein [Pseudoruegeria sp. SK021]|uniref:amphi-Trp domain-containing protein n=1 Tax=Pseudoruegeria sp. SK021 TaxID=1933035 RepID=UPI000A255859|nr:amphi-Trp domain-containing protein [Pseudoruegeria sp. SK021]OSP53767.1 amphi-Trp domain-containing protein [Pseudoruegeria sp. SK021]
MSSHERFSHESLQDAKTIKTLLDALSKGFSKGEMTLSDDEGALVMQTADLLTIRIKGERLDGHCSVSLRVVWPDPEAAPSGSSGKPRIDS